MKTSRSISATFSVLGIRCRVIGQDLARSSLADDNIIVLLHRLKQPTFFTRDKDFFQRELCHPAYATPAPAGPGK